MLRRVVIALAVLVLLTEPVLADLQSAPAGGPTFTHEETVIIERNATLSDVSKTNPWIVRKLFDAVEQSESDKSLPSTPPGSDGVNPDLDQMQRASPEAAHDLFQLLKQAGEKKTIAPK